MHALLWKGIEIGQVEIVDYDYPWVNANFAPNENFSEKLKSFFKQLTEEEADSNLFSDELVQFMMKDEDWCIRAQDSTIQNICLPAIYVDEFWASWRLR